MINKIISIKTYSISFLYKGKEKKFLSVGYCLVFDEFMFYDLDCKRHWFHPKYINNLKIEEVL